MKMNIQTKLCKDVYVSNLWNCMRFVASKFYSGVDLTQLCVVPFKVSDVDVEC